MVEMIKDSSLFRISHDAFATDTIVKDITLVRASCIEDAVKKFNFWSRNKREYPYCYNEVTLDDVYSAEVLV